MSRKEKNWPPAKRLAHWLREQSRWQRKETIARNKLSQVRRRLEQLADEIIRTTTPGADTVWAKRKIVK